VTKATGYISIIILSTSLILGPANLILRRKNTVSTYFRRDLSIVGGVLAIIHSITGLFVHLRGRPWLYFLNKTDNGYSIKLDNFGLANYSGLLSSIIIILLLVTSNDLIMKRMNTGSWKNIQRSSYLMFILALIHCYLYTIGKQNISILFWLYLPLLVIVLVFQITGISIRISSGKP
jgi:sulfoxide reductase heme-binding subunit YedZ